MKINEFREKYPEYNDLDDYELSNKFHSKFYSDMPINEFNSKFGMHPEQSLGDKVVEGIVEYGRKPAVAMQGIAESKLNPAGYVARDLESMIPYAKPAYDVLDKVPMLPNTPLRIGLNLAGDPEEWRNIDTSPIKNLTKIEESLQEAAAGAYEAIPAFYGGGALAGSNLVLKGLQSGSKLARYPAKIVSALATPSALGYEMAAGAGGAGLTEYLDPQTTLGKIGTGLVGGLGGAGTLNLVKGLISSLKPKQVAKSITEQVLEPKIEPVIQQGLKKAKQDNFVPEVGAYESEIKSSAINFDDEIKRTRKDLSEAIKADKSERDFSLLQFVRSRGGVKDVGGDLKSMDAGKSFIGLINNKSGEGLDYAREAAVEAGYLPEGADINDLLNAMDTELRGRKIYPINSNKAMTKQSADDLRERLADLESEKKYLGIEKNLDYELEAIGLNPSNYKNLQEKQYVYKRNLEQAKYDLGDIEPDYRQVEPNLSQMPDYLNEPYLQPQELVSKTKPTLKTSRLTTEQRLAENPNLTKEQRELASDIGQYEAIANKDLEANAVNLVNSEPDNLFTGLLSKKTYEAQDFENARQLVSKYFAEGKNDLALQLIQDVSEKGSKAGQSVQAMSLWSKLTPDGAVLNAQKMVDKYNKANPKKQIQLSPDKINEIRELQTRAMSLPDGREKEVAQALSLKAQQELIPPSLGQKIKTYRNISMLLNAKTLGRNIFGTGVFQAVEQGLVNTLATPIDAAMGLFTGKRTRTLPSPRAYWGGLKTGLKEGIEDVGLGINTRQIGGRFDMQPTRTFKSGLMGKLEKGLAYGLQVPDRAFYNAVYEESLSNQLRASGLKEPTKEMIMQAETEALEGVFQNNSLLSQAALGLRKFADDYSKKAIESIPSVKLSKETQGLGSAVMPYAQTPANLAQQAINYSPLGLVKGGVNVARGNQRQASQDISRALIGTGGIFGGYNLAKDNVVTGDLSPEDLTFMESLERRKNLELLGVRPQQIGGISYGMFSPLSTPLSAGAKLAEGGTPAESLASAGRTILEQPYMQGANRAIRDFQQKGVVDMLKGIAANTIGQYFPTQLGQVADVIDPMLKETYDPSVLKRGLNVAQSKIPFAKSSLPNRLNVAGEELPKYESEGVARVFDTMLNPTFVNPKKSMPIVEEMERLYQTTGSANQFLPLADRKVSQDVDGERVSVPLETEQYQDYQKLIGQSNVDAIEMLMTTSYYNGLPDNEKVNAIRDIQRQVNDGVKSYLFGGAKKQNDILKNIQNRIKKPYKDALKAQVGIIVNNNLQNK